MKRINLPLMIIMIIAGLLRLVYLGGLPTGFHSDEVLNGYVGRFTLQNGVDLYGNKIPFLYFDNFGDYPNILPMYLSGLSTYLFGVNELAVRFPIALFGVVSVYLVYLLAKVVFKSEPAGLGASFVLAIMPWHVVLSRATAEGVTAAAVYLIGLYALFKLVRKPKWQWWLTLTNCFLLTYFLYPGYRVFIPLSLLPVFLLTKSTKVKAGLIGLTVVFGGLTFGISQTVWGKGRFDQTSVLAFNHILETRQIQSFYADGNNAAVVARIFHNKYWLAGREILTQYFSYFSGEFLFTRGGLPPRYQLADQGLLFISFLLIGLTALGLKIKQLKPNPETWYLIYLTLAAPLPAALTMEDVPNIHRSLLLGILLSLFIGLAVATIVETRFLYKNIFLLGLAGLLMYEGAYFWHQYSIHATITQAISRHDEMKTISHLLIDQTSQYDRVEAAYVAHLPLHYLFHAGNFDLSLAGKFGRDSVIPQIGNIFFSAERCPSQFVDWTKLSGKVLFIDRIECGTNPHLRELQIIKQADGMDAYRISELNL